MQISKTEVSHLLTTIEVKYDYYDDISVGNFIMGNSAYTGSRKIVNLKIFVGLGDLGVTCSPREPRFSGSNLL